MLIQILISLFLTFSAPSGESALGNNIERILSSLPGGTQFSITVIDPAGNRIVFEKNSKNSLKPASNIKVFTTGTALLYLGKEYKINTTVFFNKNKLNNGILNDNIYIKGFGNALLTPADIDTLARKVLNAGIRDIKGKIIYDNSYFPLRESVKKQVSFLSPLDVPSVSPITVNNNIIELAITGAKAVTYPSSKYITIITTGTKTGSIGPVLIEKPAGYKIILNTASLRKKKFFLFVKKPELLTSLLLKEQLEKRFIMTFSFPVAGRVDTNARTELSSSATLIDFVSRTNKRSNNFLAENLKSVFETQYLNGEKQASGKSPLLSMIQSRGIDTKEINFADGSGISKKNRLSSHSLSQILCLIYNQKDLYSAFKNTLSIAGVDGTMKERFNSSPVKSNFWGKTGFLAGISSVSGYLRTRTGRTVVVAIIFNFNKKGIEYYQGIEKQLLEEVYNKN